jgi:hypothetical protein
MNKESIKLEIVNPRGEVEPPPTFITSPRVDKLAGKVIGLYSNSKPGMDNFYKAIEQQIKRRYPDTEIMVLRGGFEIRDEDVKSWLPKIDTFIYAVGD